MKQIIERKNGIKIYIIGCLIICLICVFCSGLIDNLFEKDEIQNSIKDDFYENINSEIIKNHELESDKEYWSPMFTETQDKIDDKKTEIVKEIVSKKKTYKVGTDEYKICKLS